MLTLINKIDKNEIIGLGLKKYLDKCIGCNEAVSSMQFLAIVYSTLEAMEELEDKKEYKTFTDEYGYEYKVKR